VTLIFYIAVMLTAFLVIALLMIGFVLKPSLTARRILLAAQSSRPDQRKISAREHLQDQLGNLADALRTRLASGDNEKLRQALYGAGLKTPRSINLYLASRFAGPLLGVVIGTFVPSNTVFWSLMLGLVGYLLPGMWLGQRTAKRRDKIRNGLPDALDLMVICVEAGLGLDQAMLRVGQELVISHPEINQEFTQINLEQQAGKARLAAWKSAALRTQVSEFGLFVTMLSQADKFGTPIIRALSRFADELRMKRKQRAEELAAKTKIKILFPLVIFIFPCIFVVLLAPAILNISKSFRVFE
jgi:tight adherence protein C